jgi:hypothetical protein
MDGWFIQVHRSWVLQRNKDNQQGQSISLHFVNIILQKTCLIAENQKKNEKL